jgi:hypothetical protein
VASSSRAQSEVVGVVLLTGVIVLVVVLVGTVVLSDITTQAERGPRADLESTVDDTTVTIRHQGGDSFDAGTVELTVAGDTECTARLTDASVTTDTGGRFAPGTIWVFDPADPCLTTEAVSVLVVDTETNTLLHDTRHDVPSS